MSDHPLVALKAALHERLSGASAVTGLAGGGVHEVPPRETRQPYLLIADASLRENGTNDVDGVVIDLDLVIHTLERGARTALEIAAATSAALAAPLVLDGYQCILLLIRETQARHDAARGQTRVVMRLRAFIDPA